MSRTDLALGVLIIWLIGSSAYSLMKLFDLAVVGAHAFCK